jgi:hypothetical protein
MYQNRSDMSSNVQPKTHRGLAFWLGLTLHLALAAAIYVKVTDKSPAVASCPAAEKTEAPALNMP